MTFPPFRPTLTAMDKTLSHLLREAAGIAENGVCVAIGAPLLPFVLPAAAAGVAAVSAGALVAGLATKTGRAVLSELRRRTRLRDPLPPAPSLRGAPTPGELADDWAARPRTLAVRLRLGSRMADLAPVLDASNRYAKTSPAGARRIAARGPGFKGWLADHRVSANYSTLMRYKRLALRLRALLQLDARVPLEWVLPGAAPTRPLPQDLLSSCATARRRLARLLRAHRNFSCLARHVDEALGIPRLPTARRIRVTGLDAAQTEAVTHELVRFLRTPGLPPRQEALRRRALSWFS